MIRATMSKSSVLVELVDGPLDGERVTVTDGQVGRLPISYDVGPGVGGLNYGAWRAVMPHPGSRIAHYTYIGGNKAELER